MNEVLLREELDGRFITACFALIDPGPEGAEVDLAVAGHPLPRLIPPHGEGRTVGEPGTLLGVVEDPKIGEHRFDLEPGSTLLLYTRLARLRTESGGGGKAT